MVDVVPEEDQHKELVPHEATDTKGGEILQDDVRQALKRKRPQHYNKQQQLELALAAQEVFEYGEHDLISTNFDEEEKCWIDIRDSDIWKDVTCMKLYRKEQY
jgi:hypothetical protein